MLTNDSVTRQGLYEPPSYCQYAGGPCDQEFSKQYASKAVFLYPSKPVNVAVTIEGAVALLRQNQPGKKWLTWKDFRIEGQVIFCEICKRMRFTDFIAADVTTLNFNLLFEIGFAVGLGIPVAPMRDTTIITNKSEFDELGMLDTIGYVDFQNSQQLFCSIATKQPFSGLPHQVENVNYEAPVYVVKSPIDTNGSIKLFSALSKSGLRYRVYDSREISRISILEARKQVSSSLVVAAHLLSAQRVGALVHNARCALIAGLAIAKGKPTLLLQEEHFPQPIDYRDIIYSYTYPQQVEAPITKLILHAIKNLQSAKKRDVAPPKNLLERLDLGDIAAENEVSALESYFVKTAQFQEAKRGKARLVTGRKGSGKTAIFYTLYSQLSTSRSLTVVDIKPEGHQFSELREVVLSKMSAGFQEHTFTALWDYILLCEIAHEVIATDESWARLDSGRRAKFENLAKVYSSHSGEGSGDFSERLLRQIKRITERYTSVQTIATPGELTSILFKDDIKMLERAVVDYIQEKTGVWILIDNLDKGWPTRGASDEDILIIRTLLEACRKLQKQLSEPKVSFHPLVFLRNDIYEHLVLKTPDKGKDTAIALDYDDPQVFKEIVRSRLHACTGIKESFAELWGLVFDTHIGAHDSFDFILERTLMRPRDLLNYLKASVETAINRGHTRVHQEDILKAEEVYSDAVLLGVSFEIRDVFPDISEPLYGFIGCPTHLHTQQVLQILKDTGFQEQDLDRVLRLIVWFGFLGVQQDGQDVPAFAYQARQNLDKLLTPIKQRRALFVVHPAFRKALQCRGQQEAPLISV
jgi:hypothetical protein